MSQDLWSVLQLLLKVDPAGYILKVGSFWLNKPWWDLFGAVSIILKLYYYKDLILSLSKHAASHFFLYFVGKWKT